MRISFVTASCSADYPADAADAHPRSTLPLCFLWRGESNDSGICPPVLVFVPGLGGIACNWYSTGTTGTSPCASGVATTICTLMRTKLVTGLRLSLPTPLGAPGTTIAARPCRRSGRRDSARRDYYSTQQIYFVGHSKGGLDLAEAITESNIYPLVKGVFDISSPNQGTALATWAFANHSTVTSLEATLKSEYGITLNLLVPAVQDMEVANMATLRAVEDPIFEKSLAKPFYTSGGSGFYNSDLTLVTGGILNSLIPIVDTNSQNDGFVTVGESLLSPVLQRYGVRSGRSFPDEPGRRFLSQDFRPHSGNRDHHQRIPADLRQWLREIRR